MLGNPTANNAHMQTFSSYWQDLSISAKMAIQDWTVGDMHLTTSMHTDKQSNSAGIITFDISWNNTISSGTIQWSAEIVFTSWTLYLKPTLNTLPTEVFSTEEQIGLQLLDGKWLQINDETTLPSISLPTTSIDPVLLNQQLSTLLTTTPVLKSTKEFSRNGYEIHLVDIDPVGIDSLVAGVLNTMTSQMWLPTETALSLPVPDSLENMGMKTIGVIGKKWDEIKMGMVIKKTNDPHHVVFLSDSTATWGQLSFRMIEKRTKNSVFHFSMSNDLSILGTQDMKINFWAEEDIDLSAHLTSKSYDAGTQEITAPTGAILLSDLIAQ